MTASVRYALIWCAVAMVIVISLSVFFGVPYFYSVLTISGLVFGGHLVTLDDDSPGGWSNQNNSKQFWRESLFELLIKLVILLALFAILFAFPDIGKYGA